MPATRHGPVAPSNPRPRRPDQGCGVHDRSVGQGQGRRRGGPQSAVRTLPGTAQALGAWPAPPMGPPDARHRRPGPGIGDADPAARRSVRGHPRWRLSRVPAAGRREPADRRSAPGHARAPRSAGQRPPRCPALADRRSNRPPDARSLPGRDCAVARGGARGGDRPPRTGLLLCRDRREPGQDQPRRGPDDDQPRVVEDREGVGCLARRHR